MSRLSRTRRRLSGRGNPEPAPSPAAAAGHAEPTPAVAEPAVAEPAAGVAEPAPAAEPEAAPAAEPEPEPSPDVNGAPVSSLALEPRTYDAVPVYDDREAPAFAGPLEAALRHPFLTLIPVILATAAGIAFGIVRDPVYSAEARINVGRIDVPAYTLQGVTIGNATLAIGYARAIAAPDVIAAGARKAGISPADARDDLTASQVPQSTLIRVQSETASRAGAIALANGGAQGLIDYVGNLNQRQLDADDAIKKYADAQREVARDQRKLNRLQNGGFLDSGSTKEVEDAQVALATAQLQAKALAFAASQNSAAPVPKNLLTLVVPADSADSDATSFLERAGVIGLVIGLLLGTGFALLRANRRLLSRPRD